VLATERRLLARTPVLLGAPLGDARLRLKRHSPAHAEQAHMRDGAPPAAGRVSAALLQLPFSIRASTSAQKAKRFFDRARLNKLRTRQFDPKRPSRLAPGTVGKREKVFR
jgi:hypothetical protein